MIDTEFESSVISYGGKAAWEVFTATIEFESSVISYGGKAQPFCTPSYF